MQLRYLPVRYEDVIDDQEASVREMLGFIGAPYDRRCLDFHENRRYAAHRQLRPGRRETLRSIPLSLPRLSRAAAPVVPILEPVIHRWAMKSTSGLRQTNRADRGVRMGRAPRPAAGQS